ncbi:MAG: Zn-dependent hydrolase [Bacteroidales bacterium]|nr:Zn-dependent hydrolase [Bacteroidales bacterium]
MRKYFISISSMIMVIALCMSCGHKQQEEVTEEASDMQKKVEAFADYELTADLSQLTDNERQILSIFIDIADIMDDLFWQQAFGDKSVLDTITDEWTKRYVAINYGVWDRLDNWKPFVANWPERAPGAQFYPADITKEEFEAFADTNKNSLYTMIVRNQEGKLQSVWYKDYFKTQLDKVCELMQKAADLAEDEGLKNYLTERIKAFQTDDYFSSDTAWMNMKNSNIDFVVGPVENYEDQLYGHKAAYEAFVLLKDAEASKNLAKFISMLPALQTELPCDPKYKKEVPGTESDLNVYDALYYAGDCNSGSKTIAINLPNDERVHLEKGTRRLQLRNAMQAKFDKILMPIANILIDEEQIQNIKFDAFFWNVTFHEVAHGLGIKNTVTGKGAVREALQVQYSNWEEAKADILGLYMVQKLIEKGEITNITVEEAYTTFIAGLFRSVRFGSADAHGQANMMCFNFFEKEGAFIRGNNGKYHVDIDKAKMAMANWAALILKVEGEGDLDYATSYNKENSIISNTLAADLETIANSNIPVDINFIQGKKSLKLK